jgi:aspartate/methionine/tyrosine aminotransferase
MQWAKARAASSYNLATSGVMNYPLAELGVSIDDLELSGPSLYGYEPLQARIAAKCGVSPERVVHATGASMANHLAMTALVGRGDEVLIEEPTYDPLLAVARYLGAEVKRFRRSFDNQFKIDMDELKRKVSKRTRLIVITNLHNPSSALVDVKTLRATGEIAREAGARVLVDEVYLDVLFDETPPLSAHLGDEFVVTGSLTKAYGLSGLRCGWVISEPGLTEKIWRLNDLFGVIPAHPAERLSCVALDNLEKISERARLLLDRNRAMMGEFLDSREDLQAVRLPFGTTLFPRLARGSVETLCALLREKYETTVVPGHFFEMPDHIRIGLGCASYVLEGGLERLGAALDELAGMW